MSKHKTINTINQAKNLQYPNGNGGNSTFCHTCQYDYTGPTHLKSKIHEYNTHLIMKCGIGFTRKIILFPASKLLMPEGSRFFNGTNEWRRDEMVYRYFDTGQPMSEDDQENWEKREKRTRNGALSWYIIAARHEVTGNGLDLAGFIGGYYNSEDNTMEPVLLLRGNYQSRGFGSAAVLVLMRYLGILPDDRKDRQVMFFRNCTPKAGSSDDNYQIDERFYLNLRNNLTDSRKTTAYRAYEEIGRLWNHLQIPEKDQCSVIEFQRHFVSMADGCYRSPPHSNYVSTFLSNVKLYMSCHKENTHCENLIEKFVAPKNNPYITYTDNVVIDYTDPNERRYEMIRSTFECSMEFITCKFRYQTVAQSIHPFTLTLNTKQQKRKRNIEEEHSSSNKQPTQQHGEHVPYDTRTFEKGVTGQYYDCCSNNLTTPSMQLVVNGAPVYQLVLTPMQQCSSSTSYNYSIIDHIPYSNPIHLPTESNVQLHDTIYNSYTISTMQQYSVRDGTVGSHDYYGTVDDPTYVPNQRQHYEHPQDIEINQCHANSNDLFGSMQVKSSTLQQYSSNEVVTNQSGDSEQPDWFDTLCRLSGIHQMD